MREYDWRFVLQHSQDELYQRMFEHMKTQKMPTSNPDGIAKLYSFLHDCSALTCLQLAMFKMFVMISE